MEHPSYFSIQKKLLTALSVFLLLPMIVYSYLSYQNMKTSFGEKYEQQTLNILDSSAQAVSSYITMADHAVRSVHFNSQLMELISQNGQELSPSERLSVSGQIFSYMQQIYSSVPDASLVRLDGFRLRRQMIITKDFKQYEKEHIYIMSERTSDTAPYSTAIVPTHMQYDYNFINSNIESYPLVFGVSMPIYQTPSIEEPMGKLTIDIPIEILAKHCRALAEEEETVYIIDGSGSIIYSSDSSQIMRQADGQLQSVIRQASENSSQVIESSSQNIFFCTRIEGASLDWNLIKVAPKSDVYADARIFFLNSLLLLGLCMIIIMALCSMSIIQFTVPLKKLTRYTDSIEKGNLTGHMSAYLTYTKNDEIGALVMSIKKMMYAINHFTIQQYQLELANRTNELKALQAQINPHFIYNTLQCLASQALDNENMQLYSSIATLGQLMQYSMDTGTRLVPLEQEIAHCLNYIRLQELRFEGSGFQVIHEAGPDTLDLMIPKMVIQPLAENAFKHGNLLKMKDRRLLIRCQIRDRSLLIRISDDGAGISRQDSERVNALLLELKSSLNNSPSSEVIKLFETTPKDAGKKSGFPESKKEPPAAKTGADFIHTSNHIGLCNVFMRLLLEYKNQCMLRIFPGEPCGTIVESQISLNMMRRFDKEENCETFNRR